MLAILNILYLLLPISQTGSEAGVNIIAGPNLEYTKLESVNNQDYFYNEEDSQMGFHYGLGAYYNYYLERDYYIGLKAAYRHQNTTFLEYEPEVINIEGQAVDGEFEHYFDYTLESLNLMLAGGYRLNQRFALELGLLYSMPLSDYQIHSKETIVKPVDAGVFKEEGTRIRNDKQYSSPSVSSKIGASIGFNGLFPMNKSETVFLKPSISYSYMFTDNLENLSSWKTDFIDLSVGVSFVLGENDIFAEENQIIVPQINIVVFNLDGTTERTLRNIQLQYIEGNDLLTTKKSPLIIKSGQSIITYIGIKELLNRKADFHLSSNDIEVYKFDNLEKSNRLEINLDNIVKDAKQMELNFAVETEDGFEQSLSVRIDYIKYGEIDYILTDNASDLTTYMMKDNSKKYEIYTNDKEIYDILKDFNISNLTIQTKENLPYHLTGFDKKTYLLLVE